MTMRSVKALSKQLLGARYEQIRKSLFVCVILYFALYGAEIRIAVAPFILYFTATAFTAGVMWQCLSSSKNTETLTGVFMLPLDSRQLTFSYTFALSIYVLLTKTLLILALFFAVGTWNIGQMILSLLCACNACVMTASLYTMMGEKRKLLSLLWAAVTVFTIIFGQKPVIVFLVTLADCGIAIRYLSSVNVYLFYRLAPSKGLGTHFGRRGGVFTYLLRYLFTNKNYLVNTVGMWGIACFLPFLFGQFEGLNAMPLGFAILCLNTPICVLMSCDPSLEQAIRVLPGQAVRFCSRYCLFIFCMNMAASGIYMGSWEIQNGGIGWSDMMLAAVFAFLSAAFSVGLEWLYPLRKWKVESDLWHHPRKYIVPLVMMILAVLVGRC